MRIVLLHRKTGSGNDVFFRTLEQAIKDKPGIHCQRRELSKTGELVPVLERMFLSHAWPADIVITHVELAASLTRTTVPLVGVAHHDPADADLLPLLSRARRLYYRYWLGRQFRSGIEAADCVVAGSRCTVAALRGNYASCLGDKLRVITYGVDTEFFTPSAEKKQEGSPFRLLFVGNPSARKGFDLLPEVMRELGPRYQLSLTSGLRFSGSAEIIAPNFHALGFLSREALREAYRHSHLLLFPSRLEGFGYAAVEAMACGCPVVGVDTSTMPEIIPPACQPFLAARHDPQLLADKIRLACANPPCGDSLRQWVVENFSLERMGAQYLDLAASLAAKKSLVKRHS